MNGVSNNPTTQSNNLNSHLIQAKTMNGSNERSMSGTAGGRGSVCSKRKLAGETPVKDLDPTLKMIIIKELSAEKIDG